jgi:DNA-binding NtrC family response regulator
LPIDTEAMSTSRLASSFPATASVESLVSQPVDKWALEILGNSMAMRRLRLQVRRIGPHFRTVLVSGEPGTGKELVARVLHRMSQGADEPFVPCHSKTIEHVLADREGSADSTGAAGRLMTMSQRGTLFLDGINEMPLETQGRLVQALNHYEPVLRHHYPPRRMDWRMIASTTEDLGVLVSAGRFRQDLYQRLTMVDIAVPPLREWTEDIPELAMCFLERFAVLYGRDVHEIAEEAMERMKRYRWPGNVRELEDALRTAVMHSEGAVLEARHLPVFAEGGELKPARAGVSGSARLEDVVREHVLRVLKECRGNKLRAAEVLGISRSTLYRMLEAGASVDGLR